MRIYSFTNEFEATLKTKWSELVVVKQRLIGLETIKFDLLSLKCGGLSKYCN